MKFRESKKCPIKSIVNRNDEFIFSISSNDRLQIGIAKISSLLFEQFIETEFHSKSLFYQDLLA